MPFLSEHIRSAEWLAPAAATCEHRWGFVGDGKWECYDCPATKQCAKPLVQGRWRPCATELPSDECTYKAKNQNGTKRIVRHKGSWQISLSVDSTFCSMDAPANWLWFDPGSQGNEQGAIDCSGSSHSTVTRTEERPNRPASAHLISGRTLQAAMQPTAINRDQELAALRAECRRVIGTYSRGVKPFGSRDYG